MVSDKLKIMFVLPSLRAGGAERVMSYIASHLDSSRFEAHLLIIGFEKDKVYDINDTVNVIYLNKARVSRSIVSIVKTLRKYKPDVVMSSISHVNTMMSIISPFFRKAKFIGREANVKSTRAQFSSKQVGIGSMLSNRSFKVLDAIICQSNDMLNDFKESMEIDESKFVVINNPITDNFTYTSKSPKKNNVPKYITVGTLHKRKGHERILKLLSKVNHQFHYTIIGNGNEKDTIEKLIKELGLSKAVTHVPYTKEVPEFLAVSDIFINGSFVEGFPNVLIESCAVGTPVIAFEAPGGINEIIIEGVNGHIVNTEDDYVEKLNELYANNYFDAKLVSDSVTSRYGKDIILAKYETLFTNLANGKPIK